MKIDVLSEKENPLLERREIRFRVTYSGAIPKLKDVRAELVNLMKSKDELTVVDGLNPEFGRSSAMGYAKVYKNADAMKVELKHKLKKNFEKEEKKKPAAAEEKK